jgi:LacI family gluconate utilization system Gnt-I transcriptional repressor
MTSVQRGAELFSEILAHDANVSAIFACNDDLALGTLFECQRRGINVPDELAIIGFNDLDFSGGTVPPLTTVSTERPKIATWAAEAIVEIIRGGGRRPTERSVDLGFFIRTRGSTGNGPRTAKRPRP